MGQKCPKMGQKVKNRAKMHENWLKNAQKLAIFGLKMAKTVYTVGAAKNPPLFLKIPKNWLFLA